MRVFLGAPETSARPLPACSLNAFSAMRCASSVIFICARSAACASASSAVMRCAPLCAQIETPLPLTVFVAKAAAAFDLCALNQTDAQIGEGLRLRVELRFGMQID